MSAAPDSAALFRRLAAETDESAALGLFIELCRSSGPLRHWLWEDFARDAATRAKFAAVLQNEAGQCTRFADLGGESDAWRKERERLRAKLPHEYGGLTFDEVVRLLVRHQAGGIDLAAFLLATEWHRPAKGGASAPHLLHGAVTFMRAAMNNGDSGLLRHLDQAAQLTREFTSRARQRALIGPSDWWKTHVLLYVLRHPAPAYRTRDLRAHLAQLGLSVTTRRLREFCTENGIRRDMRAGRPRKAPDTALAHTTRRTGTARRGSRRSTASELHRL